MAVRQLENKWVGSNFSEWHRVNMPSDRTMSHICDTENNLFGYAVLQKIVKDHGIANANALATLKRFCVLIGARYVEAKKMQKALQHCVYVIEHKNQFRLFAVHGNRSDLRGSDYYTFDQQKWNELANRASTHGINVRRLIRVDRLGAPENYDDITWLRTGFTVHRVRDL